MIAWLLQSLGKNSLKNASCVAFSAIKKKAYVGLLILCGCLRIQSLPGHAGSLLVSSSNLCIC